MSNEESRASDSPQPSTIRKSAHIRGFRTGELPGSYVLPPVLPIPTPNQGYMISNGARVYEPLAARQIISVNSARTTYSIGYATQLMIGHSAVV